MPVRFALLLPGGLGGHDARSVELGYLLRVFCAYLAT